MKEFLHGGDIQNLNYSWHLPSVNHLNEPHHTGGTNNLIALPKPCNLLRIATQTKVDNDMDSNNDEDYNNSNEKGQNDVQMIPKLMPKEDLIYDNSTDASNAYDDGKDGDRNDAEIKIKDFQLQVLAVIILIIGFVIFLF